MHLFSAHGSVFGICPGKLTKTLAHGPATITLQTLLKKVGA